MRRKAQASVPGDGAAVGLVTLSDESPILDVECRTYGEYAGDMTLAIDPPRKWWQAGPGEGCIGFTESKITKVLARGNRQVPEVSYAVCDRIGVKPKDLDLLVTNQPNRVFLRNWREALELPQERHRDTFDECGNLFAAGIPVNLDRAISDGQLKKGDVVMMAAFAHAGDFAGAAAVRWGGRSDWMRRSLSRRCRDRRRRCAARRGESIGVVAQRESVPAAAGGAVGADRIDRRRQPVSGVPARAAALADRRPRRRARRTGGDRRGRDGRDHAGAARGDHPGRHGW